MKKLSFVSVLCFAVAFFCSAAVAAEYIVEKGNYLSTIAVKIDHSVLDLATLNEIENPDLIFPGQKIFFVSEDDLKNAKAWAEKRRKELWPSDDNYRYFGWVIQDVAVGNIRYSINCPSGTHASSILAFSAAWKNK